MSLTKQLLDDMADPLVLPEYGEPDGYEGENVLELVPSKRSKRKCHCGSLYCNICFGYIAAKDMIQTMKDEIKLYGKL
jgi:hypothetical protein